MLTIVNYAYTFIYGVFVLREKIAMSELISKYPRILAFLFSATLAGLSAALVCSHLGDYHPTVIIIISMISAGFWMAVIGKRVTDTTRSCTYFRAAILGSIATALAIFSMTTLLDIEGRSENMLNGLASLQQTIRYFLIEDMSSNLGGGIFALLYLGWYLIPVGAIGALILRWLRKLYESDEPNEEDKIAELYEAHEGN